MLQAAATLSLVQPASLSEPVLLSECAYVCVCVCVQAVGATPESVLMLDSPQSGREGTDEGAGSGALFLQVRVCVVGWLWLWLCVLLVVTGGGGRPGQLYSGWWRAVPVPAGGAVRG